MKINWITIKVADLEESKKFYRDYLGMEIESEFSPNDFLSIVFFKDEYGMKVELIYNKNVKDVNVEDKGAFIGVATKNYNELLKIGRDKKIITVEPTILGNKMECFFVNDPSGMGIQIIKGK